MFLRILAFLMYDLSLQRVFFAREYPILPVEPLRGTKISSFEHNNNYRLIVVIVHAYVRYVIRRWARVAGSPRSWRRKRRRYLCRALRCAGRTGQRLVRSGAQSQGTRVRRAVRRQVHQVCRLKGQS